MDNKENYLKIKHGAVTLTSRLSIVRGVSSDFPLIVISGFNFSLNMWYEGKTEEDRVAGRLTFVLLFLVTIMMIYFDKEN